MSATVDTIVREVPNVDNRVAEILTEETAQGRKLTLAEETGERQMAVDNGRRGHFPVIRLEFRTA